MNNEILKMQSSTLDEVLQKNPGQTGSETSANEIDYDASKLPLPSLPYLLQLLTDHEVEKEFKAPLIIAMLPVLGTLASGVRFIYDEGEPEHSLSFLTCIEGETASGKSFVKRYVDILSKPYLEDDDRLAPLATSITALLLQLNSVGGKHVLAFFPN